MIKLGKGRMNVYADLGIADAEEMWVKAQLGDQSAHAHGPTRFPRSGETDSSRMRRANISSIS